MCGTRFSQRWQQDAALRAAVYLLLILTLWLTVDRPLAEWLRQLAAEHGPFVEVFRLITELGKSEWYLVPSGVFGLACLTWSSLGRPTAALRLWLRRWAGMLGFVFANIAVSGLLVNLIKIIIGRARPKILLREDYFGIDPLNLAGAWHSIPSGHSNTVFALAFALAALRPGWRLPLLCAATLIAASRVITNAHFLSDVVAGACFAALTTWAVRRFFLRQRWLDG